MKKLGILILALSALAFSASLHAQSTDPIGPKAKDWAGRFMVGVQKTLKLDDETAEKAREIYNRQQTEKRAAIAKEEKALKRKLTKEEGTKIENPINNRYNAEVRELLTPEQQAIFDRGIGRKLPE